MLCVAFGLLNGMILCALIFSLPALQQLHPTGLLAEYQTLAAGLLAFVGAGFTTVYLIIRAGSDDRRKSRYAQATLALAATALHDYLIGCHECLLALQQSSEARTRDRAPLTMPHLDDRTISFLQIAAADLAGKGSDAAAEILVNYQSQHARLEDEVRAHGAAGSYRLSPHWALSLMDDLSKLFTLDEVIFDAARQIDATRFSEAQLRSNFFRLTRAADRRRR